MEFYTETPKESDDVSRIISERFVLLAYTPTHPFFNSWAHKRNDYPTPFMQPFVLCIRAMDFTERALFLLFFPFPFLLLPLLDPSTSDTVNVDRLCRSCRFEICTVTSHNHHILCCIKRHAGRISSMLDDDTITIEKGGENDVEAKYIAPTLVRCVRACFVCLSITSTEKCCY